MAPLAPRRSLAWVSTFCAHCGIGEYSRHLLGALPPESWDIRVFSTREAVAGGNSPWPVFPCWDRRADDLGDLLEAIKASPPDRLVLQFHYDFFKPGPLAAFMESVAAMGIPSIVIYHTTAPRDVEGTWVDILQARPGLSKVDLHLLHQESEVPAFVKRHGPDRVRHFTHGCALPPARSISEARAGSPWSLDDFLIGTFGFLLPHKGIPSLIRALPRIREVHPEAKLLLLNARHPSRASALLELECRDLIRQLRLEEQVHLETGFLDQDQALARLQAADVLAFPYGATAESASGAVRMALGCRRPLFLSRQPLFRDFEGQAIYLEEVDPTALAEQIVFHREVPGPAYACLARQAFYLERHAWAAAALDLHRHLDALPRRSA